MTSVESLPALAPLQSVRFYFGAGFADDPMRALARNWSDAESFLAIVRDMAKRQNRGQLVFAAVEFGGCQSSPQGASLRFRFFVTPTGDVHSEDRRTLRSFGQAVAWAAELRRTYPGCDRSQRLAARFVVEYADVEDGSIAPLPPQVPACWTPHE